jgi:AP-4 complex subunit epsilon-1
MRRGPKPADKASALKVALKAQVGEMGGRLVEAMAGGSNGVSREFFLQLQAVGNAQSKEEEDALVREEAVRLKKLLSSSPPKEKMKEYVLRLLYCEMLGYEVEFGYVHALTLTQSSNLLEKKVGYLAVAYFLHKDHPLMIMVVNSFRRDLESDNYLVVCAALTTMSKLLTTETIQTVVTIVIKLLTHPKYVTASPIIRV